MQGEQQVTPLPRIEHSSTTWWFFYHMLVPILPFIISLVMRVLSYPYMRWNIFNFSDISLSMSLVSFFLAKDLSKAVSPIPNREDASDLGRFTWVTFFIGVGYIVLYAAIEIFDTLVNDRGLTELSLTLHLFQLFSIIVTIIILWIVSRVQRSFNLRVQRP